MRRSDADEFCWKAGLWVLFCLFIAIGAFGAAVRVDFNEPSISFSRAWASVKWEGAIPDLRMGEHHLVFVVSLAAVLLNTFHHSWRVRLAAFVAAFLTPVITVGPVMLVAPAYAPVMIFDVLAGGVDGEFYSEDMLLIAAIALWMVVCLVFAVRELWLQKSWLRDNSVKSCG